MKQALVQIAIVFLIGVPIIGTLSMVAGQTEEPVTIRIIVDGQQIGTMETLVYELKDSIVRIETNEIVYDCKQSVIHADRFEQ